MYKLIKLWVRMALLFFYRKHEVKGRGNIPEGEAVIFAGNHPNALMDALNIVCFSGRSPYFATRSDIFKGDWVRRILFFLKMYPVYRLRDGRANMKQNEAAFDFFCEQLLRNASVGIFPEGQASYRNRLHPLRKGMARLAFRALEKAEGKDLYIIPTGLHYDAPHDYMSDAFVWFGRPIRVNDYWDLYQKHKGKALRQLTLDTQSALQSYVLHLPEEGEAYAEAEQQRRAVYARHPGALSEKVRAVQQALASGKPPSLPETSAAPKGGAWKYLLAWPGILLHYPFRRFFSQWMEERTEDSQFFATNKFACGLLFFPFYYAALIALAAKFLPGYALLALPLIPWGGRWFYARMHLGRKR